MEKTKDSFQLPINQSIFLVSLSFGILSFILPIYSKRLEASALEIGWLFSIFSLTTLIIRPIAGKAIDKYGRKIFFVAALFFYTLSLFMFALTEQMMTLYAARFLQGIGSSLMWISAFAIASDLVDSNVRGVAFGKVDEANAKGSLYGAIFGFFFLGNLPIEKGWSSLFYIYAFASLIGVFLAYKNVPETLEKNEGSQTTSKGLTPTLLKLMFFVLIIGFSQSMVSPLLLIYLQDKFTSNIGLLAQAFIPAAIIYSFLPSKAGRFSDKYGRNPLISIGFIGSGIVSLLIPGMHSILQLTIMWALEAAGLVLALPALKAYVADVTGTNERGLTYGYYTFAASLGAVFGPLVGGYLYDHLNHSFPFYLNGILLLLNAGLVFVLLKGKTFNSIEKHGV